MRFIHPKKYWRLLKNLVYKVFWFYLVPDTWEITYRFRKNVGYRPNLQNPQTFNEKIQWLKLNDRNSIYPILIDKCKVKSIVSEVIGDEHVIPTLFGPFDSANEIPWEQLPNKFVVKCNHDAASVIICKDKEHFNISLAIKTINKCLKNNYYHDEGKQWGYKDIIPKVFVEPLMEDCDHEDLVDYKFMFFNGECKCIFTCLERRSSTGLKVNFYTPEWELMPFARKYPNTLPEPKPKALEEMLQIAKKLADYVNNVFVRIDLYVINGRIYFGEYTFYPGGGMESFQPIEWDYTLGSWIDLNESFKC
jgi:hypothetical protein